MKYGPECNTTLKKITYLPKKTHRRSTGTCKDARSASPHDLVKGGISCASSQQITMRYITWHLSKWPSSKRPQIPNVRETMEKRPPSCTGTDTENGVEAPQNLHTDLPTIWSSNSIPRYISKESEKDSRYRQPNVHMCVCPTLTPHGL